MAVIRCNKCHGFLARLAAPSRILGTVRDDRYADDNNDVIRCGSCGTIHEIVRTCPKEEAA